MEKDMVNKRCLEDNARYADILNGVIFQGKQQVREEDLLAVDSQLIVRRPRQGKRRFQPGFIWDIGFQGYSGGTAKAGKQLQDLCGGGQKAAGHKSVPYRHSADL